MLKKITSQISPLNILQRWKKPAPKQTVSKGWRWRKHVPTQEVDLQALDNFTLHIGGLNKLLVSSDHPINQVANKARKNYVVSIATAQTLAQRLDEVDKQLKSALADLESKVATEQFYALDTISIGTKGYIETIVRLYFAKEYFSRLRKAHNSGDINLENLTSAELTALLEIALRGTASERIEAHTKLYGPALNQERMQECFYALYEPEVQACSTLFLRNQNLHPHHKKNMPKFAKTYLLDKHELNMKLRCILAWSGG